MSGAPVEDLLPQALAVRPTLAATYWMTRMAISEGIPGDFVECGVFCGAQCAAMARAIADAKVTDRRVHLFDSFQGIPQAGPFDNDIRPLLATGTEGKSSGVSAQSENQVRGHMRAWGIDESLLVYHPGWFEDTLPNAAIEQIAVLRLDGDLYDSTAICMKHLFPRVSEGGWVIVDDYNLDGARKAVHEAVGLEQVYFQKRIHV